MRKKYRDLQVTVRIESLSKKGHGVGVCEKGKIEVPRTLPGEEVTASLRAKKKGVFQGGLVEVSESSEKRIQPRCRHFAECGGCSWQHMGIEDQLAEKQATIEHLFGAEVRPIVTSQEPFGYRTKMEFSFSENKAGDRFLGLNQVMGRGKVVALQECHLCPSWFMEVLGIVKDWWSKFGLHAYHEPTDRGALRTLTLREGKGSGDRVTILTVSGNPDYSLTQEQLNDLSAKLEGTVVLRIQQAQKGKPTQFYEMTLKGPSMFRERLNVRGTEREFEVSPTAFLQPNGCTVSRLYGEALDLAGLESGMTVLDLYCGIGVIGIFAAPYVKKVIGVEISADAAYDARENAKKFSLEHVEILTGDVQKILASWDRDDVIDVAFVDPPRAGLGPKGLKGLACFSPKRIVYVACNPFTQATDVEQLKQWGYQVGQIQPIDQFPQTAHIENIVILERKE